MKAQLKQGAVIARFASAVRTLAKVTPYEPGQIVEDFKELGYVSDEEGADILAIVSADDIEEDSAANSKARASDEA